MRCTALLLLLFCTTGCHNVLILSGGGFRPVIVPLTPELQCVAVAMQMLTPAAQHKAIRECEDEEERRQTNGKAASKETGRSNAGKEGEASAQNPQH